MGKNSKKLKTAVTDALFITAGCALFAAAYNFFLEPNSVSPGGVTGIAMIINYLFPFLPTGVLIIAINAPLFIAGWKTEGHPFLIKSIYGTIASSAMIDLTGGLYSYTNDPLMAAISGGVLMGAGLGLIFTRSATTGGSDIAGRLLLRVLPGLSLGRIMLAVDAVIILSAALVFGGITFALYAVVAVYISSVVIDGILYGMDSARVAYIITDKTREVVEAIDRELDRGATLLHGEGSFSGAPMNVILCAIRRRQIAGLKSLVREIDPNSFLIIMDAHEVLGDGFRSFNRKI